jgi:hypothetical protein
MGEQTEVGFSYPERLFYGSFSLALSYRIQIVLLPFEPGALSI